MTEYFRDPYGCTASIREDVNVRTGYILKIRDANGFMFYHKMYRTHKGAKIALSKLSEGMMELIRKEEH